MHAFKKVTFFDKTKDETVCIDFDSALLEAFDVQWERRRLPLTIDVVDTKPRLGQSQGSHGKALADPQSTISIHQSQVMCLPIALILPDENVTLDDNVNPNDGDISPDKALNTTTSSKSNGNLNAQDDQLGRVK